MATKKEKEMLIYKGKPLLRYDNKLYYGDFNENFIAEFTINSSEKFEDLDLASSVTIKLFEKNGPDMASARMLKKAERNSLYAALDLGVFWLLDILEMEKEFNSK